MDCSCNARGADAASIGLVHPGQCPAWCVMEGVCARSRAAWPRAVLRGMALVKLGTPPAWGFLALVLLSPVLSLFPIWPVLPWLGGTISTVDICLLHVFSSLDPLCSLPCPTHPFGTPRPRAAAVPGDALLGCTCIASPGVQMCVCAPRLWMCFCPHDGY